LPEGLNVGRGRCDYVSLVGIESRDLKELEYVEDRAFATLVRSIPDGCSVVQDDVSVAEARLGERDVRQTRSHRIDAPGPDDFGVAFGVEANRGASEVLVDRGVAKRNRHA
jgi:hypothetical protein